MKSLVVAITPGFEKSLLRNANKLGFNWMFAGMDYCPKSKYYFFDNKSLIADPLCISHSNNINPEEEYVVLKYPDQLHEVIDYLAQMAGEDSLSQIVADIRKEING